MPSRHRIVIAGGTDVGRKRGRNEDSYGVMSGDDCPKALDGLMGTTCTAAVLSAGSLIVVNAGDSRGYMFREGDLSRITRDHSLVAQLVREGQITEQQARVHPNRNVITRALGIHADLQPDVDEIDIKAVDIYMLCSDGLHRLVMDCEIGEILKSTSPIETVADLIAASNSRGGDDNITVVVATVY